MIRRSARSLTTVLLFGIGLLVLLGLTDCAGPWKTGTVAFSGMPAEVRPGQMIPVDVVYTFQPTRFRAEDRPCIASIGIVWSPGPTGKTREVVWTSGNTTFGPCAEVQSQRVTATVPRWFKGGTVSIEVTTNRLPGSVYATEYYHAGAEQKVRVSGATPDTREAPTAILDQVQMPIAPTSTMSYSFPGLIDARRSSDPAGGELRFDWDLDDDGQYDDDAWEMYGPDGGFPITKYAPPKGMAWLRLGEAFGGGGERYPVVRVKVTSRKTGLSGYASASIRIQNPGSAMVSGAGETCGGMPDYPALPGGEFQLCLWSPVTEANGDFETRACFDIDGNGVYGDPVRMQNGSPWPDGQVVLPAFPVNNRTGARVHFTAPVTAGWHTVRAIVWIPDQMTAGCATPLRASVHMTPGVLSQVAWNYRVSTGGARQVKAKSYRARSALRFTGTTGVAPGTLTTSGTVTGLITRGRFTMPTKAKAKGIARPPGLAALQSGVFVLGMNGVSITAGSDWIGPATMLMRGKGGALACFAVVGDPGKSALTLTGGTGAVARLQMTATGPALRMKGESSPPADPSAAAPKAKPSKFSGTVTASARPKARALPKSCSTLRRYLP